MYRMHKASEDTLRPLRKTENEIVNDWNLQFLITK